MAIGARPAGEEPQEDPGRAPFVLSDEEAMLQVQRSGDHRAFGLIMRRWERRIRRLCTRMTGDQHRAEELAQEAFMRLYERAAAYRHGARVSTFLWRVAVNLCLDELRRPGRRMVALPEEDGPGAGQVPPAPTPTPAAAASERERAERVRDALAHLPEHYRAVVVLRHYEGLKFRQVAEVLDIPEGTVKSRMAEALDRLAVLLGPLAPEGA